MELIKVLRRHSKQSPGHNLTLTPMDCKEVISYIDGLLASVAAPRPAATGSSSEHWSDFVPVAEALPIPEF